MKKLFSFVLLILIFNGIKSQIVMEHHFAYPNTSESIALTQIDDDEHVYIKFNSSNKSFAVCQCNNCCSINCLISFRL